MRKFVKTYPKDGHYFVEYWSKRRNGNKRLHRRWRGTKSFIAAELISSYPTAWDGLFERGSEPTSQVLGGSDVAT